MYKLGIANQDVTVNLAQFIVLPDLEESEQEPFNADEQSAFWRDYALGNTFTGYILLMIHTGMMPGELFKARKDMVSWNQRAIIGAGLKTKKRKSSVIALPEIIMPVLKRLCEYSTGPKILTMHPDKFRKLYWATIDRLGCRKLPPYSCRHTMGTSLAMSDIPLAVQQEIMRHTDYKSTRKYGHVGMVPVLGAMDEMTKKDGLLQHHYNMRLHKPSKYRVFRIKEAPLLRE